jgi:hypothetical protein
MEHWAKQILASVLLSGVAFAGQFAGWITDSKCAQTGDYLGERHKKEVSPYNPIVFVNAADKKIYVVSNPDKVKEAVGKPVSLQAKITDNTIEAEEVTIMEPPPGHR